MTSQPPSERPKDRSPILAGLFSLVIPGTGQIYARKLYRGIAVLISIALAVLVVLWYKKPAWYVVPAIMWLWNIWDAASSTKDRPRTILLPLGVFLVMCYVIGWQVTSIDLSTMTKNFDRVGNILRPMLRPDFLVGNQITNSATAPIEVPCGPNPPTSSNMENGITVELSPNCGKLLDQLTLHASGLWPSAQTLIQWQTPIGDRLPMGKGFSTPLYATTDAQGNLDLVVTIPNSALNAAPDPTKPLEHKVLITQSKPQAGFSLSANGKFIVIGIYQTLFLGLMATTLGALGAIPISFLAARNLMGGNPITLFIYFIVRTVLNIIRSIEPIIIAIIFVVIVGLGPFAGAIAMTLHTIAALGKLYSEVIEGIDQGPLEAIRATGASWLQMVRYAVIPQIVPPFTSFTIFRWDINVRTSTIIGLVGGGGIGFYLYQWIVKGDLRAVSSSFIAIAIIVIALDYVSAKIRERLV